MTTEELVKQLKEQEQVNVKLRKLSSGLQAISIFTKYDDLVLRIFSNAMNWLEVAYLNPNMLNLEFTSSTRERISIAIGKYLDTPLEDRKSEKKYYLEAVRYYSGPIAETGYIKKFECCSDYSKIIYSGEPTEFTETELKNIKRNDPALAPVVDALKKEITDDEN